MRTTTTRPHGAGRSRKRVPALIAAVAAVAAGSLTTAAGTGAQASQSTISQSTMWATQLQFDDNGAAWSQSSFAALKAAGLNTAEIDLPWNTIEPSNGSFDFTELDQELANAAAAGFKLVPIFWYSGWGGSPASWVTSHEVAGNGAQSTAPAWWDPTDQPAYFNYVTSTVKHIDTGAGYGGSILDYGFLDAQWDYGGGASGWASVDVNEFHNAYLPNTYGTISAFNSRNGTSYTAFSQVPAATPGQSLWGVYQAFRAWSVQDTYGRLTAAVRAVTGTPLYYYFGGHFGNAVDYANIPDIFFTLAKQYTVTVVVDAAQSPGLALTFGSLARAYGVALAQEWTAPGDSTQLAAQAVQWLSNYAMGMPEGGGEDFFIHDGTQKDVVGWPIYTRWVSTLQGISGSYPQQPAAVYLDFSQAYGNTSGGAVTSMEDAITSLWDSYQAGFAVVTSQEVNNGTVKLSAYKAVLPMNGTDANLNAYKAAGGTLLTSGSQTAQYAPAYATLANSGVLQVVPAVASTHTSATITLADVTSSTSYSSAVTFYIAGLGLNAGSYHLTNAGGAVVPQVAVNGGVCAAPSLQPATLAQWSMVAGAIPAGTAAPSSCTGSAACGTLTANQSLAVNQSLVSCDGRFSLTMQADGNLVLYMGGTVLWASNTIGKAAVKAIMQGDGNFVLYTSAGAAVWASNTAGNNGARLVLQNDGNLVVYSASGAALWATNTSGH
ncbi:MAG TPA: beta-galactosidase [Actinocrinis sp.]|uniref:beta-galactosidase n=1 Tax=Actinocrinis sp. TaxID=1920516 RepID=UPI002DDC9FD8|nr:beta-galactosidase [Actinocrinis sp.]HEV2342649.1 beta-galactosidase [Actinocrinis sp.]